MEQCLQRFLAIGWPQGLDWLWILLIALVIFGGRKLPELARSLGRSLNEFKKGLNEAKNAAGEVESDVKKLKDDVAKDTSDADQSTKSGKQS